MTRKKIQGPPRAFVEFCSRFPKLARAWDLLGEGSNEGPLDSKTCRLIKLGISIASRSEGATHSATRKAIAAGATEDEIYQVVALAASNLGMPSAVAAFTWISEEIAPAKPRTK